MLEVDYAIAADIAYVPTEARNYRQGKNRARKIKEVPICPRILFAPATFLDQILKLRHITGVKRARDEQARPWTISERQLAHFKQIVSAGLSEAYEAYHRRITPKAKRPKLKSFDDLKAYMDGLVNAQ